MRTNFRLIYVCILCCILSSYFTLPIFSFSQNLPSNPAPRNTHYSDLTSESRPYPPSTLPSSSAASGGNSGDEDAEVGMRELSDRNNNDRFSAPQEHEESVLLSFPTKRVSSAGNKNI